MLPNVKYRLRRCEILNDKSFNVKYSAAPNVKDGYEKNSAGAEFGSDHLANANGHKESGSINGTGCANAVSPWGSAQNHKSWNKDCWRHHHRYSINTCSSAHTYNANAYADWRA